MEAGGDMILGEEILVCLYADGNYLEEGKLMIQKRKKTVDEVILLRRWEGMGSCAQADVATFHRKQVFSSKGGKAVDTAQLQITEKMG